MDNWLPIPTAVSGYASAVANDKIYVISGASSTSLAGTVNLTQIYNAATNSWTSGAPFRSSVQLASAGVTSGVTAPELIYVIGGISGDGSVALNQVYNPTSDNWKLGPAPPCRPPLRSAVAVVNDTLYAVGGCSNPMAGPVDSLTVNECYIPIMNVTVATPSPSSGPQTAVLPTIFIVGAIVIIAVSATSLLGLMRIRHRQAETR